LPILIIVGTLAKGEKAGYYANLLDQAYFIR
jgi:hypothetical protein